MAPVDVGYGRAGSASAARQTVWLRVLVEIGPTL
jgi:hypothetical protein